MYCSSLYVNVQSAIYNLNNTYSSIQGGTQVYVGILESKMSPLGTMELIDRQNSLQGCNAGTKNHVAEVLDMIANGKVDSYIDIYCIVLRAMLLKYISNQVYGNLYKKTLNGHTTIVREQRERTTLVRLIKSFTGTFVSFSLLKENEFFLETQFLSIVIC